MDRVRSIGDRSALDAAGDPAQIVAPASRRSGRLGCVALALLMATFGATAQAEEADLADMALEDLFAMEVTSLTKSAGRLSDTPAAIFVLTGEDIRRSGVRSIPEALRMVPGLQVARLSGNKWAISARGFNSLFSDKMLVLIDGRSVYTPLYAGVYWDVQDTLLEDIDRIEVIRGPGGTLWGANAVNGVINIVTKRASETQGLLVQGGGGTVERAYAATRYGGEVGDGVQYRGYFKYDKNTSLDDPLPFPPPAGQYAFDGTEQFRGGFRIDAQPTENGELTLQGDGYGTVADTTFQSIARALAPATPRIPVSRDLMGGNVLTHYRHDLQEWGEVMFRAYYDRSQREDTFNVLWGEIRDTVSVELQHTVSLPASMEMTWGGQYWWTSEDITPGLETTYVPADFEEDLLTGFVQIQGKWLDDRLRILLGSKFIDNDHTGFEIQPSLRVSGNPVPEDLGWGRHTLWASATRAVRLPSRSLDDLQVAPPGFPTLLSGNRSADSEIVWAFEGGWRVEPIERVELDVAGYYNLYRDIFSLEPTPGAPLGLPLTWRNLIEGDGYGIEVSASWRPFDWWKLRVGYTWAELDLFPEPGSLSAFLPVGIGSPAVSAGTPEHQVQAVSTIDLPCDVEFDTHLYWVDDVPLFGIPSYLRLDLRLGWRPVEWLELYASGMNLTEDEHQEWAYEFEYTYTLVPRSVVAGATIRY